MFASISVIALISRLVRPRFNTPTVLQVILPLAFILCTVHVLVDTRAIGLIVCPVAIINIAVHMDKFTLTMCSILTPLTSINSTVRPNLFAKPVAESTSPLAIIAGSRSKDVLWPILTCGIRIVNPLSHSLTGLLLREVLTGAELFGAKHPNVTSGDRAAPPSVEEPLPCTNNGERENGGAGQQKCTREYRHGAPINAFWGGLPKEDGSIRAKCHGAILPRF